ncbi:MAG: hypothetical protein DME87_09680 [Verrucomicrobia bacterium]|nr:MAG: hypothetical protein DME87_09680 [Verrucomicrobiota bacterium]
MREFSRFDHVLPAVAEDGTPALLAPNVKDAVDRSIQIGKIDAIIFGCMHSTDHDVSKDQEARWGSVTIAWMNDLLLTALSRLKPLPLADCGAATTAM